ncbi:hypothetical protein N0V86_001402 [Didymella sp. IMI 355093]|nr:hypothetical protein N0V86_001402 [Didymella sp. IMI 355093]
MINGPSDEEAVGAGGAGAEGASLGGAGAPVGGAGASVGDGSTFVTAYDVLDGAGSLEAGTEDDVTALDEGVDVASALDTGTEAEVKALDTAGVVAFAEEEGATEDLNTCEDVNGAEDITDVSAGAVAEGKTVVYCVTMTTGGTCNDVEGRSSAEGDGTTDERMGEEAGTAAAAELELAPEGAGALDNRVDDNATLAEDRASDAAAVGKTVVYSVLVTTRRDEVVMVEFADPKSAELDARTDDFAELTGTAEGVVCDTDAAADDSIPEELTRALLRVAEL